MKIINFILNGDDHLGIEKHGLVDKYFDKYNFIFQKII